MAAKKIYPIRPGSYLDMGQPEIEPEPLELDPMSIPSPGSKGVFPIMGQPEIQIDLGEPYPPDMSFESPVVPKELDDPAYYQALAKHFMQSFPQDATEYDPMNPSMINVKNPYQTFNLGLPEDVDALRMRRLSQMAQAGDEARQGPPAPKLPQPTQDLISYELNK